MRRVPLLLLAAFLAVYASPAEAHVAPRLRIAAPPDGARLAGSNVRVVIVGEGGDGPGLFALSLDGVLVDVNGKVGGTFTTLSVLPGQQTVVNVPVRPGDHELTLTQAPDPDNAGAPQAPVVTRFTVTSGGGGGAWMIAVAALVVSAGAGVYVAIRRRRAEAVAPEPAAPVA